MRKLLNNPWVVGGLALVALAFVGMPLLPTQSAVVETSWVEADAGTPSDDIARADSDGSAIALALKDLSIASPLRDPFAGRTKAAPPPVVVELAPVPDSVDTIRLSAIWMQGVDTFVLINGAIREAGEEFSRFKIESATRDGVWVTHWKGRDFLSLGSDFTLITPATRADAQASL
jgi:hypothetical protein